MRALITLLLISSAAYGQERTWTIATAVETVEAELLSIRGDVVYLRLGDRVESVPLARLSMADHEYISSLSLAPLRAGADADAAVSPVGDLPVPLPGIPAPRSEEALPLGPATGPAAGAESLPAPPLPAVVLPGGSGAAVRGGSASSPGAGAARGQSVNRSGGTASSTRGSAASGARRGSTAQNGQRGNSNSNPGLFGFRERRAERLRGR